MKLPAVFPSQLTLRTGGGLPWPIWWTSYEPRVWKTPTQATISTCLTGPNLPQLGKVQPELRGMRLKDELYDPASGGMSESCSLN
jgi:hypothetical protein